MLYQTALLLLSLVVVVYSDCKGCQYDKCYSVGESTSDGKWTCGDDGNMHSKPIAVTCDGCQYDKCYAAGESTADGKWTCGKDGMMHGKPQPVKCDGCYYQGACRKVDDVVGEWKCKSDGKMHIYCGDGCYFGSCLKQGEKSADGKWTCGADGVMHG